MQQQPGPPIDRDVPNVARAWGGLYPRWWIISAFFLSIILILLLCFGPFFPCSSTGYLCHFGSWHPILQVLLVWSVFLLIWFIAFIFGVGSIEIPTRERTGMTYFLRSISEFGPLRSLLVIYGIFALGALIAMWLFDQVTPLAFATASIVVFIANASLFHRRTGREQRGSLIGYGVLGLIALVPTLLYRLQDQAETPFILAEVLLIGTGIWAIFWHPRPARQLTAQEQLDANIARAASPLFILRSVWPFNRLFPNRTI